MQFFALLVVAFILLNSNVVAYTKSGEETKTIDLHYADAIAEGGYLVLYHGGDTPTSQDNLRGAIEKRFPKVNFTVVVDYSNWGQRMGILSKARHPAVAKLFMNWIISEEAQTSLVTNSVRTDINTNNPWDTPEANMVNFSAFMEDRATVEQWKQTCALYLGEVQGKPSPVGLVFIPVSDSVGK
ncbi:hypothetical protein L917_15731 [Phytophthora nicotianae]|uniref:Uncharacterized protein n=1 Tax=Phytophthora nicotianae TaxID=4792 RepID=W2KHE9_PHYNI|nr:hypothetical protein L917_15731 [Phytophthora nicotianae]